MIGISYPLLSITFFVSSKKGSRLIDTRKIVFIRKDMRKIVFHMIRKEKGRIVKDEAVVYGSFSEITGQLGRNFLWCHRSYILNMDGVYAFDNGEVVLKTGERIRLGRNLYRATRSICLEYFSEKSDKR